MQQQPPGPAGGQQTSTQIDLYKMEYNQTAEFYRDGYKSIWQIFQYLSVVSAGIIAFAKGVLPNSGVFTLATGIILAWYVVIFLPLNHYGDLRERRMRFLETELNRLAGSSLGLFTEFQSERTLLRVRRIGVIAMILAIIFACSLYQWIRG